MIFWDSSAIVPLIVEEAASRQVRSLPDATRIVWWGTRIECVSAACRLEREGELTPSQTQKILADMARVLDQSIEVQPVEVLRERAERLLRVHPLRAADALQLAAALISCDENPRDVGFVCLDERLRTAASAEGFSVLPETL